MNYELLLWLIGAHFIGDFALQSSWMAEKKKHWSIMAAHVIIWTTIVCIPLKLFGEPTIHTVAFLYIGHYIADWSKLRLIDKGFKIIPLYYLDQVWHLIQLVIIW